MAADSPDDIHAPDPLHRVPSVPPIDGPFAAVLAGDDPAVARIATSADVDELIAAVADPGLAPLLAGRPRPDVAAGAHPIRLLLHAAARLYCYDGGSPELDADLLEALDGCLAGGHSPWAEVAASLWLQLLLHQSEQQAGWRTVQVILDRHREADRTPRMLASFAALAERAGDVDAARALWEEARIHPELVARARIRWLVDLEWARSHLMLSGGAPARAAIVLERVQSGMARQSDGPAQLAWIDATLNRIVALTWSGRCAEAVDVYDQARRCVESGSEFDHWLAATSALPLALLHRRAEAREAIAAVALAETDTTTLELTTTLPALALLAGVDRDFATIEATIARARTIEVERSGDAELPAAWRTPVVYALLRAGAIDAASTLACELVELVRASVPPLPAYRAHATLARALADADIAGAARARSRLAATGVTMSAAARDPWGYLPSEELADGVVAPRSDDADEAAEEVPLRLEVLDGVRVLHGGVEVPMERWQERRKPLVALALIVAAGGRIDRDELVEALWDADQLSSSRARSRLSTVLSAIRRVLRAGSSAESGQRGSRALLLRSTTVELVLADGDSTDVADLRRIAREIAASDPRDVGTLLRLAEELAPLVEGVPLRALGHDICIVTWQAQLREELVDAAVMLLETWLATRADSPPSSRLLELAASIVRLEPLDETATRVQMELLLHAGRDADASRAFHRLREALDRDMGMRPSPDLVRRHAAILADANGADTSLTGY